MGCSHAYQKIFGHLSSANDKSRCKLQARYKKLQDDGTYGEEHKWTTADLVSTLA